MKFKVGDKVRVIDKSIASSLDEIHYWKIDDIDIITEIDYSHALGCDYLKLSKSSYYAFALKDVVFADYQKYLNKKYRKHYV